MFAMLRVSKGKSTTDQRVNRANVTDDIDNIAWIVELKQRIQTMQERERIEAEYKANGLEYCGCLDWNKDGEFKQHTVNTMNDYHKKLHTVGVTPAESEAYYF